MHRHASMNRAYRLVWSHARQMWIAVAEIARGRGKRSPRRLAAVALLLAAGPSLAELPTGGSVSAGSGTIGQSGGHMVIEQSSDHLALNWQSFSIGAGNSVTFNQPSASSVALNRVLGSDVSSIRGALNANGQVFLVNPNGVLFGATAQVEVGGLVATTLALSDEDFLTGRYTFAGDSTAAVTNLGTITAANGGSVALIAARIVNHGSIDAPNGAVLMGAGHRVTLDLGAAVKLSVDAGALESLIEQGGAIRADGGRIYITAKAADSLATSVINHTGLTQAQTLATGEKGEIILLGDMGHGTVNVAGTLDASAPNGGDGGFIETSAANVALGAEHHVTTRSAAGRTGTWLIDPNDYTIAASGGDITGAQLSADLAGTNIEISTATMGTAGGNGDIHVNDAVTWNANTLTLTAERDININAVLTAGATDDTGDPGTFAALTMTTGGSGAVKVNLTDSGFTGRIDFFRADGTTARSGTGFLTIDGNAYTVITDLGAAGSTTGTDLQGMSGDLAGHYALGANIDASATAGWNSGQGFVPVGNESTLFTGSFDGLGHTVAGLTIDREARFVGLFGDIDGAELRNVGLTGIDVRNPSLGVAFTGGLAGLADASSIRNSYVTGSVSSAINGLGLLVGTLVGGSVNDSHASGDVSSGASTGSGGLVGVSSGTINGSYYAGGNLSGTGHVGGLVGDNQGTVSNSHYAIDATRINGVDGLVTRYGLYAGQFADWLGGRRAVLSVDSYFTPDGDGYYVVDSVQKLKDMLAFTESAGATFRLAADLDLPAGYWIPGFSATEFDGAGHTLSNLAVDLSANRGVDVGFIGELAAGSTVRDLTLANVSVVAGSAARGGGVAGVNRGTLDNIRVDGTVSGPSVANVFANYGFGGLVGRNYGTIAASASAAAVSGDYYAGGLVGYNSGTIGTSYATGDVAVISSYAGGLVGRNEGAISDSYALGSVYGSSIVGGLVGRQVSGSITRSYATGRVSGASYLGGLVGLYTAGSVSNSFWDIETTGRATSGGGTGKTSAEMKTLATYAAWGAAIDDAGSTGSTWRIYDGSTTPLLRGFLTPITVTADNAGKTYDALAYAGGNGVTQSDAGATLLGTASFSGSSQGATDVGSYVLTPGGFHSDQQGYDITFVDGTLTVTPAALTVTANDAGKIYDGNAWSGGSGVSYAGFVGGEDETVLGGGLVYGGDSQGAVNAGTYTITASGLTSGNYAITFVDGTLTVTPAALTVTANDAGKIYDGNAWSGGNGVSYVGFVGGEDETVLGGGLIYGGDSQGAVNAGTYTITASGLTSGNYAITFVDGTLTIAEGPSAQPPSVDRPDPAQLAADSFFAQVVASVSTIQPPMGEFDDLSAVFGAEPQAAVRPADDADAGGNVGVAGEDGASADAGESGSSPKQWHRLLLVGSGIRLPE